MKTTQKFNPNPIFNYLTLLLFAILLSCSAYDKEDDMPNPEPDPGVFIVNGERWEFSCKIDGELWVPDSGADNPFSGGMPFSEFYDENTNLAISTQKKNDAEILNVSIKVSTQELNPDGDSPLKKSKGIYREYFLESDCIQFSVDTLKQEYIRIIEIDKTARRIKGNFQYSVINECGVKRDITEGFFDAPYI